MSDALIPNKEAAQALDAKMHAMELERREAATLALANLSGLPHITLKGFPIAPEALSQIPRETALATKTICFFLEAGSFRVATVNPADAAVRDVVDAIAKRTKAHGLLYVISEESFQHAYQLYDKLPQVRVIERGVTIKGEDLERFQGVTTSFQDLATRLAEVNVSDMVTMLIASALEARSSDIHIEAEEKEIVARFRVDGALVRVATLSKDVWHNLDSRIKLIAGLKINVSDTPQDGRFTIHMPKEEIDVRVSLIPTGYGESIVMRLLRSSAVGLKFDDLGIHGRAFELLKREIARPNGMIITTGPTGSGKTTTLYAILNTLNKPDIKIITLEDPIEYRLQGIAQSQIDYAKEYTFAKGLRSILRQDPDIVMVGEIRDLETAEIAIQAALTGHLVLSTIHTNSAAGAIPRFLAMGVKPFLLAPALNTLMAQRLVRKLCQDCKTKDEPDAAVMEKVEALIATLPQAEAATLARPLQFFKGVGCQSCFGLGYRGRIGIYEIMSMGPDIEKNILSGQVSEYAIAELAQKAGMLTMAQDGILKALSGVTSLEEVFAVSE